MSTIILKKSSVSGKVPLVGDLAFGELALNYSDGKLYYKTSGNLINYIANGGTFTTALSITSSTQATSTTTGALIVTGGVGIGRDLWVGGVVTATTFIGNLTGTASTSTAAATAYALANTGSTYVGFANLAANATTATNAATAYALANTGTTHVGYANTATNISVGSATQILYKNASNITTGSSSLTFDGTNLSSPYFISTNSAGDEGGEILLSKPQTNSTVAGTGVTIDLWQNRLRFFEQGGSARGFYIDITTGGAGVATNLVGGGGSVTSLSAGTDTAVSGSTGAITIWNTSTLQSITGRGATTNQAISLTNTTGVTSTLTGALIVNGGIGVGGSIFVGGVVTATTFIGNLTGTASTATNIAGGAAGSIPYQSAPGVTRFINTGVNGSLLQIGASGTATFVSNQFITVENSRSLLYSSGQGAIPYSGLGANAPNTWLPLGATGYVLVADGSGDGQPAWAAPSTLTVGSATTATSAATAYALANTGTTYVGNAVTATNVRSGTSGALLYQSSPGVTAFIGTGTTGSILQMGANTATFVTTGSIYVGYANTATTATNAATAYKLITSHTAGTGLSGTNFDGSAAVTWTLNTSTLMATSVNLAAGTRGQIPYQSAANITAFISSGTTGQFLQATTNGAPAFTSTGSIYVGFANLAANATTATNAATAYALANTGTTHVGTANFAVSAGTATNAATAYALANTGTTYVGRAVLSNSATNIASGAANQIPYQTGAGATSFIAAPTVSSTYLQWTGSGFTWAAASGGSSFNGGTITNALIITSSTQATSTITGALVITGGVGIGGNLYAGLDGYFNGTRIGRGNSALITNLAVGNGALDTNTTGTNNIAIGYLSLNSNQTGANNVAVGYETMFGTTNAFAATAVGARALQNVSSGQYNIGIGYNAGNSITTGTSNTIIGSVSGTAGMTGTVIVAAGTIERFRVDSIGSLIIAATVSATSTVTGSLQVPGGVGIGGNLYVGGTATAQMMGYSLKTNALGSGSGNRTIDINLGNYVTATTTGTTTWTFSNPAASPNASGFVLELTNGGSAAQNWPGGIRWPGGTAPTLTASGVDILTFITDDGGTNWRGVASMLDSK